MFRFMARASRTIIERQGMESNTGTKTEWTGQRRWTKSGFSLAYRSRSTNTTVICHLWTQHVSLSPGYIPNTLAIAATNRGHASTSTIPTILLHSCSPVHFISRHSGSYQQYYKELTGSFMHFIFVYAILTAPSQTLQWGGEHNISGFTHPI